MTPEGQTLFVEALRVEALRVEAGEVIGMELLPANNREAAVLDALNEQATL